MEQLKYFTIISSRYWYVLQSLKDCIGLYILYLKNCFK